MGLSTNISGLWGVGGVALPLGTGGFWPVEGLERGGCFTDEGDTFRPVCVWYTLIKTNHELGTIMSSIYIYIYSAHGDRLHYY